MAKANWLQIGEQVNNPYLGQQMPDCGEVRRKLPAPPAGSVLVRFRRRVSRRREGDGR